MAHTLTLLMAGCLAFAFSLPAAAETAGIERPDISLAVGGSVSQMNKVAYAIAYNKGFFKDEGLNVTAADFASGTAALQSLVGGGADVAEGAFEHTIRMQTKGVKLTCIATFGRYPGNVLVVRKSRADTIRSVADLKGKKIGVSAPGSSTQAFMAQLLEHAGVSWKDASYINVGTGASAVAAMRSSDELDALVNLDPAINALVDGGDAVIMADSRTDAGSKAVFGGPYLADCLFVRADFITKYPNTTQALTNAIVHAMQWLKTASIDDVIKSLPPVYYRANEATYRESLTKNMSAFTWDGIVTLDAVQNVVKGMEYLEPTLAKTKLDLPSTFDNALVEKALAKYKVSAQ
jgi:NitT/TauT family transport system substrate-binding protein